MVEKFRVWHILSLQNKEKYIINQYVYGVSCLFLLTNFMLGFGNVFFYF